jgi:hypothetical protein
VCLADRPRVRVQPSSSHVRRVLACLRFRSGFALSFCCSRFADGPSFYSGRSAWSLRTVRFSRFVSGGSVGFYGLSAAPGRTVRVALADCPRHLAGLSTWSVRTVRPSWPDSPPVPGSFVPWFDSSLHSFVLPRVLQGIVPKT